MKCCDLTSADLKARIRIERRTRVTDSLGGWAEEWAADPAEGVWASVKNSDGTERWTADRLESLNMVYFYVRFKGDIDGAPYWQATETRIIYRGRQYNVQAVVDLELKQKWIKLTCREGEAA